MTDELDGYAIKEQIGTVFHYCWIVFGVAASIEVFLFPSIDNTYGIVVSAIGIFLTQSKICTIKNFLYYPVSTIALMFQGIFFMFMPLLATLMEMKPITYNMRNPGETFTHLLILQLTLILTHWLYKKIAGTKNLVRTELNKFNFFTKISSQELWLLIIVSAIFYIWQILSMGMYTETYMNTTTTLPLGLYAISFLVQTFYQISLVFYFKKFNIIKQPYKIYQIPMIGMVVVLFIIGIATNMRTAAVITLSNGAFCFVVYHIYFPRKVHKIKAKYVILLILAAIFFSGFFMQLSKSMVAVRSERYGLTGLEVLALTFNSLNAKENPTYYLEENEEDDNEITWDERYLSNDLLNRFCSLKVLDETIYHAKRIGYGHPQMREDLKNALLSNIPKIAKPFFHISEEVTGAISDKLYTLSAKSPERIKGARIGTLQGLGLALFGYLYIPIVVFLYFFVFYLLDAVVYYKNGKMQFSLWFLVNIVLCCYWFSDRHFYEYEIRFIFRGYWESIVAYLIAVHIVKRIPYIRHS